MAAAYNYEGTGDPLSNYVIPNKYEISFENFRNCLFCYLK